MILSQHDYCFLTHAINHTQKQSLSYMQTKQSIMCVLTPQKNVRGILSFPEALMKLKGLSESFTGSPTKARVCFGRQEHVQERNTRRHSYRLEAVWIPSRASQGADWFNEHSDQRSWQSKGTPPRPPPQEIRP